MKIAWRESEYPCQNCGRELPASRLDRRMWCPDCRREVVRRATRVARVAGALAAIALGAYVFSLVGTSSTFMMVYLVMIAAAYFFVYKMTQRVAFEIIRARGVPPPVESSDDG